MTKIAELPINSFASSEMQAGFESPYMTIPAVFLEELIGAIQGLKDEVAQLRGIIASQGEKIASLEATTNLQEDNQLIQLRLINQLREETAREEPTATESERIERIEKLCTDAPKHEISLSELRGRLGIDKAVLSRLLKRIDGDKFYLRKSTLDKRIRYLCLRPEIEVR